MTDEFHKYFRSISFISALVFFGSTATRKIGSWRWKKNFESAKSDIIPSFAFAGKIATQTDLDSEVLSISVYVRILIKSGHVVNNLLHKLIRNYSKINKTEFSAMLLQIYSKKVLFWVLKYFLEKFQSVLSRIVRVTFKKNLICSQITSKLLPNDRKK